MHGIRQFRLVFYLPHILLANIPTEDGLDFSRVYWRIAQDPVNTPLPLSRLHQSPWLCRGWSSLKPPSLRSPCIPWHAPDMHSLCNRGARYFVSGSTLHQSCHLMRCFNDEWLRWWILAFGAQLRTPGTKLFVSANIPYSLCYWSQPAG